MAFVEVKKGPGRSATGVPRIRMSAHLSNGPEKPKSIGIYISLAVLEEAGIELYDVSHNTRQHLKIMEGTNDDAGFLMLVPHQDGYACTASKKVARTLSLAVSFSKFKHYVLNECPAPLVEVEFTTDAENHAILIQCPDWLRYNSLSVEAPKAQTVPPTKGVLRAELNAVAKDEFPNINRKQRRAAVSAVTRTMR